MNKLLFTSIFLAALFCTGEACATRPKGDAVYMVSDEITLVRIAPNVYVHTSTAEFGIFGKVECNGLIAVTDSIAVMVDSPSDPEQTAILCRWVETNLGAEIRYFIGSHSHDDCIGGLQYLNDKGVVTYCHELTHDICAREGLPLCTQKFRDRFELITGGLSIHAFYPGPGHTPDNIVVWLPDTKVLFGGCLVKETAATGPGNLAGADTEAWPNTVRNLAHEYPDAAIIVPGHGRWGGAELLEHTLRLLEPLFNN